MPNRAQIKATVLDTQTLASYLAGLAAQFGGAEWPLNDASGQVADNRAYTAAAVNVVNDLLTAWTADNPDNWTIQNESAGVREVAQVASGQARANVGVDAGTGAANVWTSDTTIIQMRKNAFLVVGSTYRSVAVVSFHAVGDSLINAGGNTMIAITATGTLQGQAVASTTTLAIQSVTTNRQFTLDSIVIDRVGDLDGWLSDSGATRAQTGEQGGATATDFDGSAGMMTLYNRSEWQGMTNFIAGGMINPDATGANDRLLFKTDEIDVLFNADGTVTVTIHYADVDAVTTTTTTFSTGAWQHFAVGIGSSDNLARVYKNGAECAYDGTPTAGEGARVSNTNNLQFFKNASTDAFNGKAEKLFLIKTAPTAALAAQIYALRNAS